MNIENHLRISLGIGSLPYKDPVRACKLVLEYFPDTPFWPELSNRDFRESMGFIQTEGIPGMVVDKDNQRIYMDSKTDLASDIEVFYNDFLEENLDRFKMTPSFASGLTVMLEMIEKIRLRDVSFIKGQLSGPTTFGLIIKDKDGKAILYDDQLMDVLLKSTIMKAKWMQREFIATGRKPIIFFDEPMLQSIGSPTVPIDRDRAVESLKEVVESVDCLTGAHCCGNTDWSILMESGVDIIAFDAFNYASTMALYPDALNKHLKNGGVVAWGIVPASVEARDLRVDTLFKKLTGAIDEVSKSGVDKDVLYKRSMITPSCGLGSLDYNLAELIMGQTRDVTRMLAREVG